MKGRKVHIGVAIILALYLLTPLVGTLLYSFAGNWHSTILPEEWTFSWYLQLYQDNRFFQSLLRSILVISVAVFVSISIVLLTTFTVILYFPKKEGLLKTVTLLPYGIPGVALAIGLINIYSHESLNIAGTPWILFGVYAVVILPFAYQSIRNSLYAIHMIDLVQSAELLGATRLQAIWTTVLPNIKKGILSAVFLSVSMLFGEFALANLLVGGRFETLQIYLYQQLNKNGHTTSAIVITYYTIIMLFTFLLLRLQAPKKKKHKRLPDGTYI